MRFEHELLRGALALVLGLALAGTASAVTPNDFDEGSYAHPDGTTFPNRIFVPPSYDPSQAYPLVLFLHGSGERGTDNRRQVFVQQGFFAYVDESVQDEFPTVLVAPQLPAGAWVDDLDSLLGLVDSLVERYSIDEDQSFILTRRDPPPDAGGGAGSGEDSACSTAPGSGSSGAAGFLLAAALSARRRKRG